MAIAARRAAARFGAHTFGFVWHDDAERALATIAEAGFRTVQIMATPPHFDPWREDAVRTRRLRALLERSGLELLALDLASSDVNLASPSADVVAFSVDSYRRAIRRGAELGARWVTVGSGRRHALLPRANLRLMETFRPAFAEIVEAARREELGVILENHPQGLLAEASAIDAFLAAEGHDAVPVMYDVANAAAVGEAPGEGIRRLAGRLGVVHLSDAPAGQWRHDPIGSGDIDFGTVRSALAEVGFEGPVVLEILSDDPAKGLADGVEALEASGWDLPPSSS